MMQRFIVILMFSLVIATGSQAASAPGEYQVKAAYIYNFAKFIHWPDSAFSDAKAPLVIGVLGTNDFDGELKPLTGKKIRNRVIEIKYFKTHQKVKNSQLLYISKSEEKNLQQILKELIPQPILTVGETQYFVEFGGIIQFVTKRDRLRFSINLDVAQNNNIQIEAQLLSLAAKVVKGKYSL
ncbi:MAG: YfiR family protein [Desulfuromusa sp.]|nr:YfiR family protein [Desulfuromusa sp.]